MKPISLGEFVAALVALALIIALGFWFMSAAGCATAARIAADDTQLRPTAGSAAAAKAPAAATGGAASSAGPAAAGTGNVVNDPSPWLHALLAYGGLKLAAIAALGGLVYYMQRRRRRTRHARHRESQSLAL